MAGGEKLWGGRFEGSVDEEIDRYTRSFGFDSRLAECDLIGSLAHARMLTETGTVPAEIGEEITVGLTGLLAELEAGAVVPEGDFEDIHAWIEAQLVERIGASGRWLHTARSRNDQIGTALRLWVREQIAALTLELVELQSAFVEMAREHVETHLPGYTHLQRGQPVSLAHHLLAHAQALGDDIRRFRAADATTGRCPLGAAALAGTPHPIDLQRSAELLGFPTVYENSMHAVADRDYVAETLFAGSLLMLHLSRWAEEVILWSSAEFGFLRLRDSIAKGSSIMPQKRNPEPAEILRGRSGRVVGSLVGLLVVLKGLPLTYNSDLQEDKEGLFDAVDTCRASLRAARAVLTGLEVQTDAMAAALRGGFVTATDLADALVRRGTAFRDAHAMTGELVRRAEGRGVELWELPLEEIREVVPAADAELVAALDPGASVAAHDSASGPAPAGVRRQIETLERTAAEAREWAQERLQPAPVLELYGVGRVGSEEGSNE